tara:strand:+ start:142 stop:477 length:336 start_codon:yes stop_codon:yes gene_type:complete
MTTLEIRTKSIKVNTENGVTVVARYDDENGTYFLNEKLEKQYAIIEEIEVKKTGVSNSKEMKEYRFNVEYAHKGMERGWNQKDTKVSARNYNEAIEKVEKKFKTIYEISEL